MLKKMVVLAVIGFVAVTAIGGTKLGSYIRSEFRAARQQAEDSIPPEKEIERLKSEVNLLDGDIKKLVHHLAKERVEVNDLKDKVDTLAAKQSAEKDRLQARAELIKKSEKTVTVGTRTMSVATAKTELEADVKSFANTQKSLDSLDALLANRIKVRDSLEKQLETMKNQKAELKAAVDGMEAELAMLKLQQMESKYQTDDTRLAKIKEDLRNLKKKVDVKREELKLSQTALDETTAPATTGKSVDEIMAPLAPAKKPEAPKAD